jgi:hypothetical protein
MIASFGNLTLLAGVKFPKLAITASVLPTYREGRDGLAGWSTFKTERRTRTSTPGHNESHPITQRSRMSYLPAASNGPYEG